MRSPLKHHLPALAASMAAMAVVLLNLDAPLVEDGLFWWVPKALWVSENGFAVVLDQLPQAARPDAELPPQWQGGLPDYAHPPLWYWTLALFLKLPLAPHHAVHVAALPFAALFGAGCASLLRRAGGERAAWAAMVLPLVPPVAAQLLRADTDLPLLAATPWALVFILDRRDGPFAVVAALATWCKEPGILLAAPALVACLADRRWGWGWLAPPLALAAWAGLHFAVAGWGLAGTERLPETLGQWLQDLGTVLWIVVGEQWRWLLLPAAALGLWRWTPRRRVLAIVAVHTAVQLVFFGTLNFLGGIDRIDAYTHVRYLLPGLLGWLVMVLASSPPAAVVLAVVSAIFLHRPSPYGPESSIYGLDVGRAVRAAELPDEGPVWVGSYAWTQLTRPYAGVVSSPRDGLHVYGHDTDPALVRGTVVEASDGEPLGRLQELNLVPTERFEVRHAWVQLYRVD